MTDRRATIVATGTGRLAWTVAVLSAGVLGFELALMRVLLVSSWHHFAFLVISIALLGFGASGTALCLLRPILLPRQRGVLLGLIIATAISMPLCTSLAQHVPVEARFLPALFWGQLGRWLLYWALLGVPFLLGASAIGLALIAAGDRVAVVYGSNLLGSGCGAWLGTAAMWVVPPQWLAPAMGAVTLLGVVTLFPKSPLKKAAAIGAGILAIAAVVWLWPPQLRVDPYKYLAYVQRLEQQGAASRLSVAYSPRSVIELYRSDAFHDMPFLSVGETPPPMDVLVIDGHWAGSVPRIQTPKEAAVVDRTLMAFAYAIAPQHPRVLLLGERGGWNTWLALRHGAALIHVVQPDPNLFELLQTSLDDASAQPLGQPTVRPVVAHPRHLLDHSRDQYDIIQLVSLEGLAAGSGGIAGLGQDHLVTVEGITAAVNRLTADGLVFVCRGIQTPPRDNLKLLATFIAALGRMGIDQPQQHMLIVRDYLAVCTVAKASPWTAQQIAQVRRVCADRELTPIWFPGIRKDELNQPDALPGPEGSAGDWYHYAATQLFSGQSGRFIDQWAFDIRPPTDDRPFFFDFFKARSIATMQKAYGDLWLTRVELGFAFVLAAMIVVGICGAALTVLPLLVLRGVRTSSGKWATAVYFVAIGLAYLMLEITALSWLTRFIGDPVHAAALTIATFLVASGLGSLTAQRVATGRPIATLRYACVVLVLVGLVETFGFGELASLAGGLPLPGRFAVAMAMIAPLGFVMGLPMPIGLHLLQQNAPPLVPWAWGVNGFASVLAPCVATAIGMTWGFAVAGISALALYVVAAAAASLLPRGE